MSVPIQHGKRTIVESYYEGNIASTKREIEVSVLTSQNDLLKDVIDALTLIRKGETSKLDLSIQVDKLSRVRLIKKWLE